MTTMKKLLKLAMIMIAMTCCTSVVIAKNVSDTTSAHGIMVKNLKMERVGDSLFVDMNIDLASLKVSATELAVFTPCLKNGNDSIMLQTIGVYGRNRYIYYQRNPELNPISQESEALEYKKKEKPDTSNASGSVRG